MQPSAVRIPFRQLLVIILALLFALIVQAWLSRTLLAQGYEKLQAHYLAYLSVPPMLLLMLAPVLSEHRNFLAQLFRRSALTMRLALAAVALGVTMRAIWWSQLVARISLGITVNDDPQAIVGPVYSWACPPLPGLLLGMLVMAVLIPVMEETIHRGVFQSAFANRGPVSAILVSSSVFTVFHPPSSFVWVFIMGLVMGAQFWLTGALWASVITHATYNGLIQLDWRCLQGQWNPPPDSLPQLLPGVIALAVLAVTSLMAIMLLRWQRAGALGTPAPVANPARSQHAR